MRTTMKCPSRGPLPPGFLRGGARTVRARIEQCAERIYYRLHMWRLDGESRAKSPMPPAHALGRDLRPAPEIEAELAALKGHFHALLERGAAGARTPAQVLASDYDSLAACPTGTHATRAALEP